MNIIPQNLFAAAQQQIVNREKTYGVNHVNQYKQLAEIFTIYLRDKGVLKDEASISAQDMGTLSMMRAALGVGSAVDTNPALSVVVMVAGELATALNPKPVQDQNDQSNGDNTKIVASAPAAHTTNAVQPGVYRDTSGEEK